MKKIVDSLEKVKQKRAANHLTNIGDTKRKKLFPQNHSRVHLRQDWSGNNDIWEKTQVSKNMDKLILNLQAQIDVRDKYIQNKMGTLPHEIQTQSESPWNSSSNVL